MTTLEELKQIAETINNRIFRLQKEEFSCNNKSRLVVKGKYLYISDDNNRYRYLGSGKLLIAKQLAQERYNRSLLKVLEKQKEVIGRCIRDMEKAGTADSIYAGLSEAIKPLVDPGENSAEGYAIKWQAEKQIHKYVPESSPYYTAKGEHVRSKSEVIIADRLNANGVPYHYETAVSFSGLGVQYPDFRALNKRTGKVMFWEHFGMMEDPAYCRETIQKLENYEADGCVLGRDLIVSFESTGKPLSTKHVERLINDYLK